MKIEPVGDPDRSNSLPRSINIRRNKNHTTISLTASHVWLNEFRTLLTIGLLIASVVAFFSALVALESMGYNIDNFVAGGESFLYLIYVVLAFQILFWVFIFWRKLKIRISKEVVKIGRKNYSRDDFGVFSARFKRSGDGIKGREPNHYELFFSYGPDTLSTGYVIKARRNSTLQRDDMDAVIEVLNSEL